MKMIPRLLGILLATTIPLGAAWAKPLDLAGDLGGDALHKKYATAQRAPVSTASHIRDSIEWMAKNPAKTAAISAATAYFAYCVALQGGMNDIASDVLKSHSSKIATFFGDDAIALVQKNPLTPHMLQGLHKTLYGLGLNTSTELMGLFSKNTSASKGAASKTAAAQRSDIWQRANATSIIQNVGAMTLAQIMAESSGLASYSSLLR